MDLLSEIVRLKHTTEQAIQQKYFNRLIELKLPAKVELLQDHEFLTLSEDRQTIRTISDFLTALIHQKDIEKLAKSIVMAYYFHGYRSVDRGDENNDRMINAATDLVDTLTRSNPDRSEVVRCLDTYYAHYSIWASRQQFEEIEDEAESLYELFYSHDPLKLNQPDAVAKYTETILDRFESLLDRNRLFTIEGVLQRYHLAGRIPTLVSRLWDEIGRYYEENRDHCFILLSIETRYHLLNRVKTAESKRKLFYDIDPEELLEAARSSQFTNQMVDRLITEFVEVAEAEGFTPIEGGEPVPIFFHQLLDRLFEQR